ncbi:MAG TPA: hypothetical protein VLV54_14755 [Thermoanaerobaculia bacterium]|nr:hypothetical protein [Thermoanaerobaculia bacterium]
MSEEGTQQTVIVVTKAAIKPGLEPIITGTNHAGASFAFLLKQETKIRRLTPTDSTRSLSEILAAKGSQFPVRVQQEIIVDWKTDPKSFRAIAVKITVME